MYYKKIPTQVLSCEYCDIFKNTYFEEHLRTAASILLIIKLIINIGHLPTPSELKNITWNGFYHEGFVDLVRIYFLLIVSRHHSNRVNIFLISGFRQVYAGCCPLHNVYFNDIQISRWRNFKDQGHLFTSSLLMTTTKVRRISLLRTFFFISLDKSVLLYRRCCLMLKFPEILMLLCRKIFSLFYPIVHETFSNSCNFAFI